MLTPQKNREIVFHLLYSSDFIQSEGEEMFSFMMQHHKVSKKTMHEVEAHTKDIQTHLPEIDKVIAETANEYELERIPKVERNLLRLGVFELCFSKAIPPKVAIAEAVRLARKFATAESAKFVNAILDTLYKKQIADAV